EVLATSLVDEFGFYIDEYDTAGNWISGQWLGAIYADMNDTVKIDYKPTSANVHHIRLQNYYYGTTGGNVYLDNVSLYALL
ncbi:hypothetical protein KJ608_00840, partial [Patescibacteria group bacterium]|nr:hypothetical protein [Patescibacteria group bacterium]